MQKRIAELNQIKIALVKNKRTGKWLAEQLGKSTCTVSKWCSNSAQPDLYTLSQISNVLGCEMKDLISEQTKVKTGMRNMQPNAE